MHSHRPFNVNLTIFVGSFDVCQASDNHLLCNYNVCSTIYVPVFLL